MTDKIKSFFKRKVVDRKFVNAGKGYKLTESASSRVHTPVVEPIQRAEPTEEAKVAGRAALARLDAAKNAKSKLNVSYTAIQAQVKRELERERRALQEAQQETAKSQENVEKKTIDNSLYAAAGIYFRCPYLSNEILPQDEWRKKIKEFLYEQLKGEEAGLTACLVIRNCNSREGEIQNCVKTLGKYLENIINNPEIEKYRKIRVQNKIFQEKVLPMEGAQEFLNAAGFHQKKLMNNDVEEDFLVWDSENCDIETVTLLLEALQSAEKIPLELDRNLRVLLPTQARKERELPPTFFNLTPAELKREQQLQTEAVENSKVLKTAAMRKAEHKSQLNVYKYSIIRVKFPDNIFLQGTFSVHEKLQSVFDFVKENLLNSERPFGLHQLGEPAFAADSCDKTLFELKLVPSVIFIFLWLDESPTNSSTGYLKEELLSYIQPH